MNGARCNDPRGSAVFDNAVIRLVRLSVVCRSNLHGVHKRPVVSDATDRHRRRRRENKRRTSAPRVKPPRPRRTIFTPHGRESFR